MSSIENLSCELLGILAEHCRVVDLKSLACCNKRCSDMMVPVLWKSVDLDLEKIMDGKPFLFERLKHTTKLKLNQRSFNSAVYRDEGGNLRDAQLVDADFSALRSKVADILQFCEPSKVKTLVLENPCEVTLDVGTDILRTVQELELLDWSEWGDDDNFDLELKEWHVNLPKLNELKSLSVFIPDATILFQMMDSAKLKSLDVLLMGNEETSLMRIGEETGLERLIITLRNKWSTIDLTPLSHLKDLRHLELYFLFSYSEDSLIHLCCNLQQLRTLKIKRSNFRDTLRITDRSLSELKSLVSLEDLTLAATVDGSLTSKCLEHISRIPSLRSLTIDAAICNNENIYRIHQRASQLNNIPTLRSIFVHVCIGAKKAHEFVSGILFSNMWKVKYTEHGYDYSPSPDHGDGHYSFVSTRPCVN